VTVPPLPPPRKVSRGSSHPACQSGWQGAAGRRNERALAFFGRVLASSLSARSRAPPPPLEIFNSSASFAFDLNFFNRSLKTGTTFRSTPRVPGSKLPPSSVDVLGGKREEKRERNISVFALQMTPGSRGCNFVPRGRSWGASANGERDYPENSPRTGMLQRDIDRRRDIGTRARPRLFANTARSSDREINPRILRMIGCAAPA